MDQLNQVHLNGLRAVEVAGRLGTLALAAAELGVSLGAVSQPERMRCLREEMSFMGDSLMKSFIPTA